MILIRKAAETSVSLSASGQDMMMQLYDVAKNGGDAREFYQYYQQQQQQQQQQLY